MKKQTNWFKDAIIYQIYPRSFCDGNGDGIGDIKGITSKIDHLVKLGINCVWLSPVYKSPMCDNGYDISDYMAIEPLFGTMDDFKEMIQKMHDNGIRLIMDLVMNHTSSEHPWFIEAKKSINNPYHDYYIFKKGKVEIRKGKHVLLPPNNWTGFFGEKAWKYNKDTDEWYLHLFAEGQPDVNWENEHLREEFVKIIKFWCDLGVDGFRCDVINLISKDQSFADGKELLFLKGGASYINGPRLHEYLHYLNKEALSLYDVMTVGETVFSSIEDIHKMTDESREELSMVFNFDHTSVDNFFGVKWFMRKFSLRRWKKILSFYQENLNEEGWNSIFYENHDQRRSVGRFNTDDNIYRTESAKMLATSMYFLKGTPFIYEGQEIGMTNGDFQDLSEIEDVETHNIYKTARSLHLPSSYIKKTIANGTRDNARTPMQWDDSKYAGFSTVKPWLKVNANKSFINVKYSYQDDNSIFTYYQKLLKLRKSLQIVKDGKYECIDKNNKNTYIYRRFTDSEEILVIANYSKKNIKINYPNILNKEILINNYPTFDYRALKPYQAVILKIK